MAGPLDQVGSRQGAAFVHKARRQKIADFLSDSDMPPGTAFLRFSPKKNRLVLADSISFEYVSI